MSTDLEMLRAVLKQTFIDAFQTGIKNSVIDMREVAVQGEKYLSKMIPQTYIVHIPTIDALIYDGFEKIDLSYADSDTAAEADEEDDQEEDNQKKDKKKKDIQKYVLQLIFRKTHIVFTIHKAYLNNIIPTTIRGLSRLLAVLNSMEDVPEIDFNKKPKDMKENEFLAKQIKKQSPVLRRNLQIFETYFITEWIPVKLSKEQSEKIKGLKKQTSGEYVTSLLQSIYNYYLVKNNTDKPAGRNINFSQVISIDSSFFSTDYGGTQYINLDELICSILGEKKESDKTKAFRENEDFLFMFAVRTLLSLAAHKDANRIRKKAAEEWKPGEKIVFNYHSFDSAVPVGMYMDNAALGQYPLTSNDATIAGGVDIEVDKPYYIISKGANQCYYSFLGGIFGCLNMDSGKVSTASQREIYEAQEAALTLAGNFEIQRSVRKFFAKENWENHPVPDTLLDTAECGFAQVQKIIRSGILSESYLADAFKTDAESVWFKFAKNDSQIWERTIVDNNYTSPAYPHLNGSASRTIPTHERIEENKKSLKI